MFGGACDISDSVLVLYSFCEYFRANIGQNCSNVTIIKQKIDTGTHDLNKNITEGWF